MRNIHAAIIGCGAIYRSHLAALRQIPGVTLRAVADIDRSRGEKAAADIGCRYYPDYREMLRDPDIKVVHICTPHHLHRPMIVDALARGKQVFCEKPAAMNGTEIALIRAAADAAAIAPAFCYQNRYNPSSQAIRQQLALGELGRMLSIRAVLTWSRSSDYYTASGWRGKFATEGGSLLINQAIHTLDLMQWFAGGVAELKGTTDSSFLAQATEAEDSAMVSFRFRNGARGLFYGSNGHSTDAPLLLEIDCEGGSLLLQDNTLWLQRGTGRQQLACDTVNDSDGKGYWGKGHRDAIAHYYAALRDPAQNNTIDLTAAARSLEIVEAIYRSSQLRQWVTVSP